MLSAWQPGVKDARAQQLAGLLALRGYSEAELAYAAKELIYDPAVDRKMQYKGEITAADFERVVGRLRSLRARLRLPLMLQDVNRLIEEFPTWLSWDDFGIADYTAANTPIYRFCYSSQVHERRAVPVLPEARPVERSRDGTGLKRLGDLL